MIRLGITGHQSIPTDAHDFVVKVLDDEIRLAASRDAVLWGITSLAAGADQLFAEIVLDAGGQLRVIIPSHQYETTFDAQASRRFEALLGRAAKVERLQFNNPCEEAFLAAGKRVVDLCETLIAVWDGAPSRGLGGTADVVEYAQSIGRRVDIIWPAGVVR